MKKITDYILAIIFVIACGLCFISIFSSTENKHRSVVQSTEIGDTSVEVPETDLNDEYEVKILDKYTENSTIEFKSGRVDSVHIYHIIHTSHLVGQDGVDTIHEKVTSEVYRNYTVGKMYNTKSDILGWGI